MSQEKEKFADEKIDHLEDSNEKWNELRKDAMRAEENEMSMGLFEALRTYPTAAFWSFAISLCIVMEGYDTQVLGNIMGLEQFRCVKRQCIGRMLC
jgi:SP family general alpha glucoside:H+ symporter-like MFS transporter